MASKEKKIKILKKKLRKLKAEIKKLKSGSVGRKKREPARSLRKKNVEKKMPAVAAKI
jgi:cell division protein FtsB